MASINLFYFPDCYIRTVKAFIRTQADFGVFDVVLLPRTERDSPYSNFQLVVYTENTHFCFSIICPSSRLYQVYVDSISDLCKSLNLSFKIL